MGRRTRYYDVMDKDRFIEVLEEQPAKDERSRVAGFAKKLGCNPMTIWKYLNEYGRELSPEIVKRLVQITGVSMDWLYGLSDTKYRNKFVRTESYTVCESCPLKQFKEETEKTKIESKYVVKNKKCTRKAKKAKLVKGQVGIDEIPKKTP